MNWYDLNFLHHISLVVVENFLCETILPSQSNGSKNLLVESNKNLNAALLDRNSILSIRNWRTKVVDVDGECHRFSINFRPINFWWLFAAVDACSKQKLIKNSFASCTTTFRLRCTYHNSANFFVGIFQYSQGSFKHAMNFRLNTVRALNFIRTHISSIITHNMLY